MLAFREGLFRKRATIAMALLFVICIFVSGILDTRYTFDLIARIQHLQQNERFFIKTDESGKWREGLPMHFLPGEYTLQISGEAREESHIGIRFFMGAEATPSRFDLPTGSFDEAFDFKINGNGRSLMLEAETGQNGICLDQLELVTPPYNDRAWILLFIFAGALVLWQAARKGRLGQDGALRLACMAGAVAFSCISSLCGGVIIGHDGMFHLARIENVVSGICSGEFPVRVGGFMYNGFGSAVSVFYPDAFILPAALMCLTGASLSFSVNTLFAACSLGSCVSMYTATKRLTEDENAAACAAVLYTLAPYRLSNLYIRFAIGEALAMVFLPLFIEGLWRTVRGDGKWTALAVSASFIFLSHIISSLLCGMVAAVFCFFNLPQVIRGRWKGLFSALVTALMLCFYQILPMMDYSLHGVGASSLVRKVDEGTQNLSMLLRSTGHRIVGPVLVLYGFIALAAFFAGRRRCGKDSLIEFLLFAAAVSMTLACFNLPWKIMSRISHGITDYVQFPWRLNGFASLFLAFAGGWGIVYLSGKKCALPLTLALAAFAVIPQTEGFLSIRDRVEAGMGPNTASEYQEYLPSGTDPLISEHIEPILTGNAEMTAFRKQGTDVTVHVSAMGSAHLSLPLFAYDGYRAEMNGRVLLPMREESGRLGVDIPAESSGVLHVFFRNKALWRIGDVLSLVAWLMLAPGTLRIRRRTTKEKI